MCLFIKNAYKKLCTSYKSSTFAPHFAQLTHYLINLLTYYEPIRNRFHFDSRFV